MLKRLVLIGGSVAAAVFLRSKAKQQQAEQELWSAATDDVQPRPATPVPTPAPSPVDQPQG